MNNLKHELVQWIVVLPYHLHWIQDDAWRKLIAELRNAGMCEVFCPKSDEKMR